MSKDIAAVAPGNARRSTIGIGDRGVNGLPRLADLTVSLEWTLDGLAARPPSAEAVEEPIAPGPSAIFLDEGPPPALDVAL